ncbi:MAG: hypothetical protein M3382_00265 [Thermoproteota archaeon]|nr:hypothetical protein [Thermoproteota archaeon]
MAQLFDLLRSAFARYTHLLWHSCIKSALVTGLASDGGGGEGHLLHDSSIVEFVDIE